VTTTAGVPTGLRDALAGRYTLDRELGQGGMATVYLARDVRHERHVALKVLDTEQSAALGAERFDREIKVLARVRHPFVLPLHDSGEAAGSLYFVMPYIDGESWEQALGDADIDGRSDVYSLGCSKSVKDRVERLLLAELEDGDVSMETLARKLGLSRQTLFRRLKTENTTFEKVLAFSRAFKRWTGSSPRDRLQR
jgi:AraC-like DNA-binding protein